MDKKYIKKLCIFSIIMLLFSITNCSMCGSDSSKKKNSDNDNDSIALTGRLGSDYETADATAKNRQGGIMVDKVKLILTEKGNISWETFQSNAFDYDIDENGQFSIPFADYDSTKDWVVLLMNTQAANKRDQIVGYIGMADAQNNSLLMMPMSDRDTTVEENLDLGEISQVGDESLGTTTIEENASHFTLDEARLSELARTDTFLKNLKNAYVNYDPETDNYYFLQLTYNWIMNDESQIKNQWSNPAVYAGSTQNYAGYRVGFQTNVVDYPAYNDVITGAVSVEIFPPDTVTDGCSIWNPTTPFTNDELPGPVYEMNSASEDSWTDGDFAICNRYGSTTYRWISPSSDDPILGTVAQGYWTINVDTTTVAEYDIGSTNPFDANGKPIPYIPAIRIDVAGSSPEAFSAVQIKWYMYNPSSSMYEEVTDISVIEKTLWYPWFAIGGENKVAGAYISSASEEYQPQIGDTAINLTSGDWSWFGETDGKVVKSFYFSYKMGSINYNFSWNSTPSIGDRTIAASATVVNQVDLSWNKATDNISDQTALQYAVYYSTDQPLRTLLNTLDHGTQFGGWQTDIDTVTVTGLTSGHTYYFNVVVQDEAGNRSLYYAASATTP